MKITIMGPPGGGKGTQAEKLSEILSVPHISTGAIIRNAIREKTSLGLTAEEYITDKYALNKTKTKIFRGTGDYRSKTIDFVDRIAADAQNAEIEATVLADENSKKYIDGKPIKKVIIVPKKIVNVVI